MAWLTALLSVLLGVAFILMHVLFMVGIWHDCRRLENSGRPPAVLSPLAWALAGLLTGLMGVALYWLAHYSRFARANGMTPK